MSHSHVSNLDKSKFEHDGTLGIGAISHDQMALRNNLLNHVAGYLAMGTDSINSHEPDEHRGEYRRFGRSQLPNSIPEGTVKRGRPRSGTSATTIR
jgi:hypothetical protein